jgi:hypothetical protein
MTAKDCASWIGEIQPTRAEMDEHVQRPKKPGANTKTLAMISNLYSHMQPTNPLCSFFLPDYTEFLARNHFKEIRPVSHCSGA